MLNEFLEEASIAEFKKGGKHEKWRTWKPRTCLGAEH